MSKSYYSLGLMSGTSGDGIDASIITSNGENQHESIIDRYFEYSAEIISTEERAPPKCALAEPASKDISKIFFRTCFENLFIISISFIILFTFHHQF